MTPCEILTAFRDGLPDPVRETREAPEGSSIATELLLGNITTLSATDFGNSDGAAANEDTTFCEPVPPIKLEAPWDMLPGKGFEMEAVSTSGGPEAVEKAICEPCDAAP